MTEMLFVDGRFLGRRDPTYSASRQAWQTHSKSCSVCMQKIMIAFCKAKHKETVYRKISYLRSCKQDEKTGIYTCTFLCDTICSFSVGIETEPHPVKKGGEKSSGRRVNVGQEGKTVVRKKDYLVSDKRRMINTNDANFIKEAKKVLRSLYASREMKQEHHSWIIANCPYKHIQNWVFQSTKLKRTYRGVQVHYFKFPRQNHNELFKLVRWLEKIVKYE